MPARWSARRVEQEAARELLVPRPRVEQRRRAGEVLQRREQPVELQRVGDRLGQGAGDAHEELLRGLDHQSGLRVLQQVAVVDRAQPEVLEFPIALAGDRVVQLPRVGGDELHQPLVRQPQPVRRADRLREGVDLLAADLLVDVGRQQPGRELRVLRLFDDERRRGLDRELVELARGRAVVEAADRLGRDPQRIDVRQPAAAARDRADDLVDVDRLGGAAPLAHPHRCLRGCTESLLCASASPVVSSSSMSLSGLAPTGDEGRQANGGETRTRAIVYLASRGSDLATSREASR